MLLAWAAMIVKLYPQVSKFPSLCIPPSPHTQMIFPSLNNKTVYSLSIKQKLSYLPSAGHCYRHVLTIIID